ncbi:MAG: DNA repair protein RadA, partial [Alphaproteobacteria bacterium]
MARRQTVHVCQACGASAPRWQGKCDACGAWNTLVEESVAPTTATGGVAKRRRKGPTMALSELRGGDPDMPRLQTAIAELDRVAGGGLVPGSALLVGGDPGIGKSTLLLEAAAGVAKAGGRVVYVSGEEAIEQVRLRARRLGLAEAPVSLAAETSVDTIVASLSGERDLALLVIDSIQTMHVDALDSAPGTVAQVRASTQALIRLAKTSGTVLVLVGHVTKEGTLAGPRVLEHMVDTVLYFEGERGHQFRILRAVKNRFGPTDEIGVFEMSDGGLRQVSNPSALFLGGAPGAAATPAGAAVFAGIEGTRPLLVEIQALVAPSGLGTPRRAVVGWDGPRLAMVLAVLEARANLRLSSQDVYLNVAGGLRIAEPAADLAVAAALVSSATDVPVPAGTVIFGEIGLAGEVRPVGRSDVR